MSASDQDQERTDVLVAARKWLSQLTERKNFAWGVRDAGSSGNRRAFFAGVSVPSSDRLNGVPGVANFVSRPVGSEGLEVDLRRNWKRAGQPPTAAGNGPCSKENVTQPSENDTASQSGQYDCRNTSNSRLASRMIGTAVLDELQPLRAPIDFGERLPLGRAHSEPNFPELYSKVRPRYPQRLVIVRHGQSAQNMALDLMDPNIDTLASVRDCDIQLTPTGGWQSEEVGKYLAETEHFDVCYTSPYIRAVNTAELIIGQLPYKLKMYKDNRIREKEFGRLHGLDAKSVQERFPEEYKLRERDGRYWYHFPGGENYPAVELRMHSFLENLCRDFAGRNVLVVTHQVPYKLFRSFFAHLDEKAVLALPFTPNAAIQEYVLDCSKSPEGRMKLKTYDFVAYKKAEQPECPSVQDT